VDLNCLAVRIVKQATEGKPAETAAQVSGRKGGQKGGKARATKLSPEQRSEIARKAAVERWKRASR
jgi:hypothetical protein